MKSKQTISISEARKRIFDLADDVQAPGTHYTLTEKGRAKAVIMSADDFESWRETLEVISDFPDIDREIAEKEEAVKTGEYKSWPTLQDVKRDWGRPVKVYDRPKRKYGVQRTSKTKGKKKS